MVDARQKTLQFIATFTVATAGFSATAGADTPDANAAANAFFERALDERLAMEPTVASVLGLKIGYDRWTDPTERADSERKALSERHLAELRTTIDPSALDATTRLSWQVFENSEERRIARYRWRNRDYRFDKNGAHVTMPAFLINTHRVESEADALAYIRRLEGVRPQLEQLLERAAQAAEQGILPPRFVFPYVIEDSRNIVTGRPFDDGPADSPLLADIRSKVEKLTIEEARRGSLLAQPELALLTSVMPGYEAVIAWAGEAAKIATDDDGVWKLPDGAAYYDYLLENFTTAKLSADEIHAIGLREVARLHGDMRKLMKQVEFEGDLQAFYEFMRADPRLYYEDPDAGRAAWHADAHRYIAGMRAKLPEYFITLPKSELVVNAVEPFREQSASKAFYRRPSLDGTRPGVFYGNLYQMSEMPKYELEALVYHEALPGHHMQIAIATEEESQPRFRRLGGYTAYSEGWGLYSERLGKELGFYSDPWSEFGHLAFEMRERAAAALGARFDLREFHDLVLRIGAVPLTVLESEVQRWVESQQG
jgi:uncharacterized protein (DUF885 family)